MKQIKSFIKKTGKISNIGFFAVLFILLSLSDIIRYSLSGEYKYALLMFLFYYLLTFIVVKFVGLVKWRYVSSIIIITIVSLAAIQMSIDLFCQAIGIPFTYHIVETLFATNASEMQEFIRSTVPLWFVVAIIVFVTSLVGGYMICNKYDKFFRHNKVLYLSIGVLFASISVCLHYRGLWKDSIIARIPVYFSTEYPRDLHQYLTHPKLSSRNEINKSPNIVLIVGESYSANHSSLYGYPHLTCPKLQELRDSGNLIVYKNVNSAMHNTIANFKCMMSTYRPEYGKKYPYYECTTLQEVFNTAGYYTLWISNQAKTSVWENVIGRYAELCDSSIFINANFSALKDQKYDEELIPVIKQHVNKIMRKQFWLIHLMGSHVTFSERYPQNFNRFTSDDYNECLPEQRSTIAEYDNSILYNDSVVAEIFHLFDNCDAIIVYLSDHGLDIYNSDERYVGHGKLTNELSMEAATKIPFLIYTTANYKALHPKEYERWQNSAKSRFRTDDLIYTLMDIAGLDFQDNDDVKRYSLFNQY